MEGDSKGVPPSPTISKAQFTMGWAMLAAGQETETAGFGSYGNKVADWWFPQEQRVKLLRTWGGGVGLLPVGGDQVWGNNSCAPDHHPEMRKAGGSYG